MLIIVGCGTYVINNNRQHRSVDAMLGEGVGIVEQIVAESGTIAAKRREAFLLAVSSLGHVAGGEVQVSHV